MQEQGRATNEARARGTKSTTEGAASTPPAAMEMEVCTHVGYVLRVLEILGSMGNVAEALERSQILTSRCRW